MMIRKGGYYDYANGLLGGCNNIEDLVRGKDLKWFTDRNIDCVHLIEKSGNGRSCSLLFGFDMFTENEDGTICNSLNDIPHWYLEIMPNNDEEDCAFKTDWLYDGEDAFLAFLRMYDLMDEYLEQDITTIE